MVVIVMVMVFAVHHSIHLLVDIPYPVFGLLADSASHRATVFVPLLAESRTYTGFANVKLYLAAIARRDG
jgi:hypothetical protein